MKKRKTATLCVIILIGVVLAAFGCGGNTKEPSVDIDMISEFAGGRLYQAGKIYVAQLNGDYREMGRQYGGLMKKQINQFYDEAVDGFFSSHEAIPRKQVESMLVEGYGVYPARIQEVFEGMKETSGMTLEQLVVIDNTFALPLISGELAGCSMVAAWGEYTGGEPLVYGRNFDYAHSFQGYNDTLTVVVYNPDDGSRSTATIVNAGQVGTTSAFNDADLVMAINVGTISGGQDFLEEATPTLIDDVTFMLDSSNLETLVSELKGTRPIFAINFNVADAGKAYSVEETTTDYRQRDGRKEGLLVSTNHFVEPTWNLPTPTTEGTHSSELWANTTSRYEGLISLCDQRKGSINAETMMEIFDVPMDQGGALQPDTTIYQFVTVPAEQQLWVKAYGYQDWVLVELGELFDEVR